jgi:hypothetical protein
MSFLRRLLGGESRGGSADGGEGDRPTESPDESAVKVADEAEADAERAHEREVAREEAERLDELQQRQLRFAAYSWKPAAQGGERRAGTDESTDADDPAGAAADDRA